MRHLLHSLILTVSLLVGARLQAQLPVAMTAKIDTIAAKALADSGTPGLSIAVIKDGDIALVKAYGNARLEPPTPATPEMRYPIGSVSKQFMACAILLLAQEERLSLDDPDLASFLR